MPSHEAEDGMVVLGWLPVPQDGQRGRAERPQGSGGSYRTSPRARMLVFTMTIGTAHGLSTDNGVAAAGAQVAALRYGTFSTSRAAG
jgi:hypothetical protein